MSTILQDSEIPLYMQVSEWVRGKIYKGELGKGTESRLKIRSWKYFRSVGAR